MLDKKTTARESEEKSVCVSRERERDCVCLWPREAVYWNIAPVYIHKPFSKYTNLPLNMNAFHLGKFLQSSTTVSIQNIYCCCWYSAILWFISSAKENICKPLHLCRLGNSLQYFGNNRLVFFRFTPQYSQLYKRFHLVKAERGRGLKGMTTRLGSSHFSEI